MSNPITAFITPMNEGQLLGYVETVKGAPGEIAFRAKVIIQGLKRLLPSGAFAVQIEANDHIIFMNDEGNLFNDEYESLPDIHILGIPTIHQAI